MSQDARQDFGRWEITARLDGIQQLVGLFERSYPEDAATQLAVRIRMRFDPSPVDWHRWSFVCERRDARFAPSATFSRLSPTGPLVKMV